MRSVTTELEAAVLLLFRPNTNSFTDKRQVFLCWWRCRDSETTCFLTFPYQVDVQSCEESRCDIYLMQPSSPWGKYSLQQKESANIEAMYTIVLASSSSLVQSVSLPLWHINEALICLGGLGFSWWSNLSTYNLCS